MECETEDWIEQGRQLSDLEAESIETALPSTLDQLRLRVMLIAKYAGGSQFKVRWIQHMEWLIENYPSEPRIPMLRTFDRLRADEISKLRELWSIQADKHSRNVTVLSNAAASFLVADPNLAESFFLQALRAEPNNREIRTRLAALYSIWPGHSHEALIQYEKLLADSESHYDKFVVLNRMPALALNAGDNDKAREMALQLLALAVEHKGEWNYGNAINSAHTVLGRLFLNQGDLGKAKYHLAQSIVDVASPQTQSFGPSFDLVSDLIAAGETWSALQYLTSAEELCGINNSRALELQYQIHTGINTAPSEFRKSKEFTQFVMVYQLSRLAASRLDFRRQQLKKLIDVASWTLELYANRASDTDNEVDDEKLRLADFLLKLREMESDL